jgi:hypothetical protein
MTLAFHRCAFFRVWCLVELASALQSSKPVVMVVGDIDAAGQFVPMTEMLENLYLLVSITKATASNPEDLRRELDKIEQAPGVGAMDTLIRGAISGAHFVMDFPEVMRAACGQDEDGMERAFRSMEPARREAALCAASAAGFEEAMKALSACEAKAIGSTAVHTLMTKALMHASTGGHTAAIEALIAKGAEVNAADNNGTTALMRASSGGHTAAIEALLVKGAKVNAPNNNGTTALMRASSGGHTAAIEALIAKGAEVNAADNAGQVALMHASMGGHTAAIEALIANGAEVNTADKMGSTALKLASLGEHTSAIEALRQHGADAALDAEVLVRMLTLRSDDAYDCAMGHVAEILKVRPAWFCGAFPPRANCRCRCLV